MMQVFNNRPVNRQLDHFINDFFNLPSVWNNPSRELTSLPPANVHETDNGYQLEINAPGRNKEDFKVNVDKDLLTVSYEKKDENNVESGPSIRREFIFNSFTRSFSLDKKIDVSNIQAKYENGILKIDLPSKPEVKEEVKQITIS